MIDRILLMLRARKFVGQAVGVHIAELDGILALRVSRAGIEGIKGDCVDGDRMLVPWRSVQMIEFGPAAARIFAHKRKTFARHAASCPSCSDSPRTGSFSATEIAAMLREPEGA